MRGKVFLVACFPLPSLLLQVNGARKGEEEEEEVMCGMQNTHTEKGEQS